MTYIIVQKSIRFPSGSHLAGKIVSLGGKYHHLRLTDHFRKFKNKQCGWNRPGDTLNQMDYAHQVAYLRMSWRSDICGTDPPGLSAQTLKHDSSTQEWPKFRGRRCDRRVTHFPLGPDNW